MIRNALAIYVERWCDRNDINVPFDIKFRCRNNIISDVDRILKLLGEKEVKATFFILGDIAEEYPQIVYKIYKKGHEIASHGYRHNLVYSQTKEEFKADLKRAIQALQAITHEKVLGYSAPSWSIINKSMWALDVLKEEGLLYDSSVFPIKTFLYGIPDSPRFPYKINGSNDDLTEFPPSTVKYLGRNIPFSGGVFFRLIPYWVIKRCIRKINKEGKPVFVYIHSWELDASQPRLRLPLNKRVIPYANLKFVEGKLRNLLNGFEFRPIRDIITSLT